MSATDHYDTNVTDEQWALLEPLLPARPWQLGGSGRPPLDKPLRKDRSCQVKSRSLELGVNPMKFDNVTQWVRVVMTQVPPGQSLANRPVEESAGKPGNGSPKPDNSRMQALY